LESEEVRRRADRRCRSFALPVYRSGIVIGVMDGTFGNVGKLGKDVIVGDRPCKLEVAVRDVAGWVVKGN